MAAGPAGSRPARPQPPGPGWDDRAREIARLLVDGRTADVHARATAGFRRQIPAERVERVWRARTRDLGPAGEVRLLPPREEPSPPPD